MPGIESDIEKAASRRFNLVIVGGGIHGAMLALEASLRGLETLLLEKDDFGAATSYNSLRIIHGGFRYLQRLDLGRLLDSARERQWFLRYFPDFVRPQACLMPLYGKGLRRPLILGGALKIYNRLTARFNQGLPPERRIPEGHILTKRETLEVGPSVRSDGLMGGALWYDAFMPDSQRILIGALRWASSLGAMALNYCRADEIVVGDGRVAGVRGVDCRDGRAFEFRTDVVINAAGPWCREVALRFHTDIPHLFRSMLAWNVLFDRPAISTHGLAVSPPGPGGHTYFIVPWKGMLLAGTGQSPWQPEEKEPRVDERQLTHFCQDLNRAMPSLALRRDEIVHVFAGLQSATRPGGEEFTKRHLIVDHSRLKGPQGLFSISGIKFTTARKVAEETLNSVFPQKRHAFNGQEDSFYTPYRDFADQRVLLGRDWQPHTGNGTWRQVLQKVIVEEAVRHLDDLIIRRTDLGDHPVRAIELAGRLSDLFAWGHADRIREMERLRAHFSYLQPAAVGTREESTLQAQGY